MCSTMRPLEKVEMGLRLDRKTGEVATPTVVDFGVMDVLPSILLEASADTPHIIQGSPDRTVNLSQLLHLSDVTSLMGM